MIWVKPLTTCMIVLVVIGQSVLSGWPRLAGAFVDVNTASLQPIELEPQPADLTIRFQHVEPSVHSDDVQAAWTFDEGSGYEFRDVSGNGHTAYITGTNWNTTDSGLISSFRQEGRRAGGIYLNGTQWLQVQHASTLNNTGQISLSVWFKVNSQPSGLTEQPIVGNVQRQRGFALLLSSATNSVRFVVYDDAGGEHSVTSPEDGVRTGEWVHVVGTCDAATGEMSLFLNGLLVDSVVGSAFTPGDSEGDLAIGHALESSGAFAGWVDEVVIHRRSLSTHDVWWLYVVGLPKLYRQTRETIDSERQIWSHYKGNQPIPHAVEADTLFSVHFNGSLRSDQGHSPIGDPMAILVPGVFGGAYNAATGPGLTYPSPITGSAGTFEAWFIPVEDDTEIQSLFKATGPESWLELYRRNGHWIASIGTNDHTHYSAESSIAYPLLGGVPVHVALTWDIDAGMMVLFLNGTEVARTESIAGIAPIFNEQVILGEHAGGYIDDVRLSSQVHKWGDICPRGHVYTETSALDLMDSLDRALGEPLAFWQPGTADASWQYAFKAWEDDGTRSGNASEARRALYQGESMGLHPLFHPDAYGYMSSIEAGMSFEATVDGWAGVFVQSHSGPSRDFSGYSFALNPATNQMRIAVHRDGTIITSKELPYDFTLMPHKTYTLTLASINDGVLRGYIDGNNVISMINEGTSAFTQGYAGLFTERAQAYFDDVHFSALTPAAEESRLIQQRIYADGQTVEEAGGYTNLSLNAFRWSKRYGLLPWEHTYKNPQPPGFILSADDGIAQPNPPAAWRSEDSAISDLLNVDGTILLVHRGNSRIGSISGVAQIGVLTAPAETFDGIHFADPNGNVDSEQAHLFRGHLDTAPEIMREKSPRNIRFQVNDQGATYIGDGRVLVFAREFRNHVQPFPWYRRLVYNIYDVRAMQWEQGEGYYVEWSAMDPTDSLAQFTGIDGTPDVTALRDPVTDEYILFLFHQWWMTNGVPTTGITGLQFNAEKGDLVLHPDYPTRETYTKPNADVTYGERVFFDNGIYYLHYNSDSDRIIGDWPDRLALAASLHPYTQPWVNSADNNNSDRPYFERGSEFDHDNAAIWSGQIFALRGRYYLYYEAFHAIDDVNVPYQNYDHLQAGSRLAFATGN